MHCLLNLFSVATSIPFHVKIDSEFIWIYHIESRPTDAHIWIPDHKWSWYTRLSTCWHLLIIPNFWYIISQAYPKGISHGNNVVPKIELSWYAHPTSSDTPKKVTGSWATFHAPTSLGGPWDCLRTKSPRSLAPRIRSSPCHLPGAAFALGWGLMVWYHGEDQKKTTYGLSSLRINCNFWGWHLHVWRWFGRYTSAYYINSLIGKIHVFYMYTVITL